MATLPESRRTAFPVERAGVLPVIASAQKPERRPGAEISRAGMGREAHALAARQNGPKRERRPVRSAGGNAPVFDRRGGSVRPECCKPATRGLGAATLDFGHLRRRSRPSEEKEPRHARAWGGACQSAPKNCTPNNSQAVEIGPAPMLRQPMLPVEPAGTLSSRRRARLACAGAVVGASGPRGCASGRPAA